MIVANREIYVTYDNIWEALKIFEDAPLYDGAVQLLEKFGLRGNPVTGTDRQDNQLDSFLNQLKFAAENLKDKPLHKRAAQLPEKVGQERNRVISTDKNDNSLDHFLHQFKFVAQNLTEKERLIFKHRISQILAISRVTEKKVTLSSSSREGEDILADSIIIIAADIYHSPHVDQNELQSIIWALNKGFGTPVIGLFRYDSKMAFAAAAHRQRKRRTEEDVRFNSGVTLDISLQDPHQKHRDFIIKLQRIIGSGSRETFDDIIWHLVDVPNEFFVDYLCKHSDEPKILRIYLEQIYSLPLLTRAQERELARDIEKHGQKEPWTKFITSNLRLVVSIARRHSRTSSLDFLDLIQEGNIGLMTALDKFKYQLGHRFSTYATWWIRQAVTRSIENHGKTIRIPVHMADNVRQLNRITKIILDTTDREVSPTELAEMLGWSESKVQKVLKVSEGSTDPGIFDDDDENTHSPCQVVDEYNPTPSEMAVSFELVRAVHEQLSLLNEREAMVLKMRFGIDMDSNHTLEQVGQKLGVTRERIRQIEKQAINKLRRRNQSNNLYEFWEY